VPQLLIADNAGLAWCIAGGLGLLTLFLGWLGITRQAAYRAARDTARNLSDLYENTSDGVFRSTLDGRMISANPALVRLNGFSSEAEMLREVNDIGGQWYVEPGRREEIHRRLLAEGRISGIVSEVFRYKTRERIWISESTRLVRDPRTGAPLHYDGTVREVTETVRRLQLQERFEKIAAVSDGCLYQMRIHPDGRLETLYISVAVKRIYGISPEEAEADPRYINRVVHPDDRERLSRSFAASNARLEQRRLEYRVVMPDGMVKWISAHSVPERQADGSILLHGYAEDVTERKIAEARVQRLAYSDQLTGLPNRTAFVEKLDAAIIEGRRDGSCVAVFFVDLDQFKMLNDTKGHHAGDALLVLVARRLEEVVGDRGVIARLGGDEFVAMVPGRAGTAEEIKAGLIELADSIQSALVQPFTIEGLPFRTSASIGVSCFGGDISDASEHIRRADLAMYEAKASGRANTCFFVPAMQERLDERLVLTNELHEALDREELVLVCQPQVQDGLGVTGVEVLMRWDSPTRGEVSPSEFVPLAERAGLSGLLDTYVIEHACLLLRRWATMPSLRDLTVAVNVSCRHLRPDFARTLAATIDAADIDPGKLTVELTEHVMLDNSASVAGIMEELRALGVRIALDDFGTGYSSLTNLKMLPIDYLKIDLSFVQDLEDDPNDRVIVQTIVNIARSLGKQAIAEGVETDMQVLLLRQFGCRAFQGFLFGRPMATEEFENWIAHQGVDVFYGRPGPGGAQGTNERNSDGRPSRSHIRQ